MAGSASEPELHGGPVGPLRLGAALGTILVIEIERGSIGPTTVTFSNCLGARPVAVESTTWAGMSLNRRTVKWPARVVIEPVPPKP